MHSKLWLGRNDKRTYVERCSFAMRHPIPIHIYKSLNRLEGILGGNLRHTHSLTGVVHTFNIFIGSKQLYSSVGASVRLEPLKKLLCIMEYHRRGFQHNWTIGNNSRIMPSLACIVIHHKHVVCKIPSKSKTIVCWFYFFYSRFFYSDIKHNSIYPFRGTK